MLAAPGLGCWLYSVHKWHLGHTQKCCLSQKGDLEVLERVVFWGPATEEVPPGQHGLKWGQQ